MRYISLFTIFSLLLSGNVNAQIELPALFSDNMVLQQEFEAPFWGWAEPGEDILVSGSWDQHQVKCLADENGDWNLRLPTPAAGGPYFVTINDDTLHNVMIGEVWICSGQSNMKWELRQTDSAGQEIEKANFPDIRLFYVARDNADEPRSNCYGKWEECTPESAETFSAVAYYFGKELHHELDVPIGLIHTSWGGSTAQAWINNDVLESTPEGKYYLEEYKENIMNAAPGILVRNHQSPAALYNAMLHPLIPYGIRGAIWYQGESNTREHYLYRNLMESLISDWRAEWGQGDFPFYFVQLAPYDYDNPLIGAALRDAQRKSLDIPNTGMAVTMDIGDPEDIHPLNKKDVGKRLAAWALNKDYGKDMVFSGPLYSGYNIEDKGIRLFFDHVNSGLESKGEELSHFEIAGTDNVFYPAKAVIDEETIIATSEDVIKPLAVRYAFHNTDEPNLFNKEGFPASSFRTDNYSIFTEKVKVKCEYLKDLDAFKISMESGDRSTGILCDVNDSVFYFNDPFIVNESATIKATAYFNESPSLNQTENHVIKHLATGKKVDYVNECNPRYSAGGEMALVNGIMGSKDFYDGNWQGFKGQNMEVTIDLGEIKTITQISSTFLHSTRSWIFPPEYVEYFISKDGTKFKRVSKLVCDVPSKEKKKKTAGFVSEFKEKQARFIKVKAKSFGKLPGWHPGSGEDSWLFIDEVIVL